MALRKGASLVPATRMGPSFCMSSFVGELFFSMMQARRWGKKKVRGESFSFHHGVSCLNAEGGRWSYTLLRLRVLGIKSPS